MQPTPPSLSFPTRKMLLIQLPQFRRDSDDTTRGVITGGHCPPTLGNSLPACFLTGHIGREKVPASRTQGNKLNVDTCDMERTLGMPAVTSSLKKGHRINTTQPI